MQKFKVGDIIKDGLSNLMLITEVHAGKRLNPFKTIVDYTYTHLFSEFDDKQYLRRNDIENRIYSLATDDDIVNRMDNLIETYEIDDNITTTIVNNGLIIYSNELDTLVAIKGESALRLRELLNRRLF